MQTPFHSFPAVAPWLGIAAVFWLAGGVKGVTGMGLPTVAVSLLGLWMPPAQAAALLVVPSLLTNLAQCRGPAGRPLAALLWPVWLGMAAATLGAPEWPAGDARRALGAILLAYGLWGLWRPSLPQVPVPARPWAGLVAGLATGWITASTAVFVLPLVPYLQALRLEKAEMVQALGLSFTVATLLLFLRLQAQGHASPDATGAVSVAIALGAALLGLAAGSAVRRRISPAAFQRGLFLVFIGLGAVNLWRAA